MAFHFSEEIGRLLQLGVGLNILLGLFNLLPVPPSTGAGFWLLSFVKCGNFRLPGGQNISLIAFMLLFSPEPSGTSKASPLGWPGFWWTSLGSSGAQFWAERLLAPRPPYNFRFANRDGEVSRHVPLESETDPRRPLRQNRGVLVSERSPF